MSTKEIPTSINFLAAVYVCTMYMFPDRYKYMINKRYVYNGMECFSQYIKDNYTSMFTTPKKMNKKKMTTDKILKIWCQKF